MHISVMFDNKLSYKHLYNDIIFGKARHILSKQDLPKLNGYFEKSMFVKSNCLYKKRKDGLKRFYYFETTIREEKVFFNVAKEVYIKKNGRAKIGFYLYAITDKI